ncbi:hypothetical protein Pfo_011636 [Paulownia fortunei]|nr:hypothetical protein Pfo_011636 [Paulownia fortunei]
MDYSFLHQDSYGGDRRDFPVSFSGLPILENAAAAIWFPSLYDETGDFKRLKRTTSVDESVDSNSISSGSSNDSIARTNSTNTLSSVPRLQFRDHIWTYTQQYLAAEAVEEAAATIIGNGDGMKLVQQLISCSEAVACRDKSHASLLLSELRANALVFGSCFQRVASCFVQGLADRLALVQPLGTVGYVAPKMNIMDIASEKREEASRLVYEICPHIQFGHFVVNSTILEAFEGESLIHVVDLGLILGLPHGEQWHGLIQSLAERRARLPACVSLCIDKFCVIGEKLEAYAVGLGLKLEFSVTSKVFPGEVLVVNSILQLHCVVKESRGALNSVLQIIHELSPKVLVLMEQFYFAEEIKNIVSCEGPARVERHERVDQWRRRMSWAGFQPAPLKMVAQAKQWLSSINACEGYTIVEEKDGNLSP